MSRLSKAYTIYTDDGLKKLARKYLCSLYPTTNIYEKEWDVLVILDACRTDLMEECRDDFSFLNDYDTVNSVGTKTTEWIARTFTDNYREEMANTIYISGNPNSAKLDQSQFLELKNLWSHIWDDDAGTIPPRPITDHGIEAYRNNSPDYLILHYMQPHYPFLNYPSLDDGIPKKKLDPPYYGANDNKPVWERLKDGELSRERVWEAYRDNLTVVLEDIELLLRNIDADVVISSDHGNAIGEFGVYGHPAGMPIPALRKVPWVETRAENTEGYRPSTDDITYRKSSAAVEEKLSSLGYLE